jgi:hypothetical protein
MCIKSDKQKIKICDNVERKNDEKNRHIKRIEEGRA